MRSWQQKTTTGIKYPFNNEKKLQYTLILKNANVLDNEPRILK